MLTVLILVSPSVLAVHAGTLVKHPVTPQISSFVDQKISKYTKAKCIMSYAYQTITSSTAEGYSSERVFEIAYQGTVANFKRTESLGQEFNVGKTNKFFWLVSNSSLAGSTFIYSDYGRNNVSIYSCKASF